MATKKILHDLDLQGVSELKSARIHNVTSAELTTLAGALSVANRGLIVYNTTDTSLYTWNGSSFDAYAFEVTGDIRFVGAISPTSSASITPAAGHQFVADVAGTLSTQSGLITYTPSANVEPGDVVLFTTPTTATVIQRNLEAATETTLGTIRLSSQGEVDAGSVADEAVTPATLHGYVNPEFAADRARLTANEAGIASNAADIATEAAARAAADTTLQTNIGAEAAARAAADTTLQGNIDAEATARAAADTTLQGNIATEEAARIAGDSAEASARAAADAGLQANIDTEAASRAAADTTLQTNIDAEAATRAAADATLQSNINAEAVTRAASDSALDTRIIAVEARDEVFVYTASVGLTADTAFTVSHNLGLTNKDSFTINTMHGGEQVSVQVSSVDTNTLTLTSAVGVTGLVVSIIGF